MKKLFVIGSLLSIMPIFSQQKNVFWDRNFWNEHTTIAQVVTEIKNGNSPLSSMKRLLMLLLWQFWGKCQPLQLSTL